MKIIVCVKVVPDEEVITVNSDRTLALENVPTKISQYDLNALEVGKELAKASGGTMTALTVGPTKDLEPTKIRKDILSRGADDLALVIDDSHDFSDSLQSAKALASAISGMGDYDLVLCGTGSSDLYAQVTGIQLGALLGVPTLNNVTKIEPGNGKLSVTRTLEDLDETFEVPTPAVISVSSEINTPPVPAMMDIMKAGKKPAEELAADLSGLDNTGSTLSELAPEEADRRREIIEGDGEEQIDALVALIKKEIQ